MLDYYRCGLRLRDCKANEKSKPDLRLSLRYTHCPSLLTTGSVVGDPNYNKDSSCFQIVDAPKPVKTEQFRCHSL